ncbi:helix-turn-helix domain-containing protein [Vreelandella venusta]|uniref:XRE family transcriptional regulator n=1 Tax=Vreelandella venusta TaxID=44935 RepID=A0ABX2BBR3_9GAMM|nr:helix-turn-helix transcriptional regulator [Halomonas venusta]AZM95978.1 XRE family transcriptional regulator [Halomonas venusta]MDW0357909.1 helix-turn-helix transcriptional regulator [Halomonas venusta]NPT30741.1 XRE family transcriptional regulator [Halomonas venusta]
MSYATEQILESLREARARKGFSQRELSARSGVPQSHISKIESGGVDLRVSSLIALARVLDLELFVAPKKSVPAIKSIIRSSKGNQGEGEQVSPAYQLDGDSDE